MRNSRNVNDVTYTPSVNFMLGMILTVVCVVTVLLALNGVIIVD